MLKITDPVPSLVDVNRALDELAEKWNKDYGSASNKLRPEEAAVIHAVEGERYLRLATGGWSENEALITKFKQSWAWFFTWRLSAVGGLYVFYYFNVQK